MVGENGEALGEGKDNFDSSYNIDTNFLLNKMKKKAQFLDLFIYFSIRTNKNALIKVTVGIKKVRLCKINAGRSSLNNASVSS